LAALRAVAGLFDERITVVGLEHWIAVIVGLQELLADPLGVLEHLILRLGLECDMLHALVHWVAIKVTCLIVLPHWQILFESLRLYHIHCLLLLLVTCVKYTIRWQLLGQLILILKHFLNVRMRHCRYLPLIWYIHAVGERLG
jgi:hypothetical protein